MDRGTRVGFIVRRSDNYLSRCCGRRAHGTPARAFRPMKLADSLTCDGCVGSRTGTGSISAGRPDPKLPNASSNPTASIIFRLRPIVVHGGGLSSEIHLFWTWFQPAMYPSATTDAQ